MGGWRVWTLTPGETFLRAPFYGTPWPEASVVATCQCRPRRHNPLDLLHHSACHKGIHALDDPGLPSLKATGSAHFSTSIA